MPKNPYNRKAFSNAWVAQLVEHSPEEGRVGSSSLPPSTEIKYRASARIFCLCLREGDLLHFRAGEKLRTMFSDPREENEEEPTRKARLFWSAKHVQNSRYSGSSLPPSTKKARFMRAFGFHSPSPVFPKNASN